MKLWEFIEYENADQLLVYKHPCQDFNNNTKLIVRDGQVAIFLHNGKIADIFQAGRYKLSTENLPILGKIMNIFTGGKNTFSAEVFFISTINLMNLKWGTLSPMDLQDPKYKIIAKVSACGEASFKIINPESFFKSLVGTTASLEKNDLIRYFRSMINMHIKNAVSKSITHSQISLLDLNSYLLHIASSTRKEVNEMIASNGTEIVYFSFDNLGVVDGDQSLERLKKILEKRTEMDIIGYSYQQERSFDVLDTMSAKEGNSSSNIASTIIEAGIGIGVASSVVGVVKDIAKPMADNMASESKLDITNKSNSSNISLKKCLKCNADLQNHAKFCSECGTPVSKKRFCINCGSELPEGAKFCLECGAKQ